MPQSKLGSQSPSGDSGGSNSGTMFVKADSACFRDLVQRLTGPSINDKVPKSPAPKPTQKLHERRKYTKPKLEISKPMTKIQSSPNLLCLGSPSSVIQLSPPISLPPSPITSNKRVSPSPMELNRGEEEKAIKEKRFYLHPSPRSKPRLASEPELLTLFPLASPTACSAANET
ncbi:hypothetical protein ACJIZ3_002382 [Penstemon smallii]|uniref:VQ domain-containing protein n=1 Tax=Penstemon smallii TaxID=265156 RepID=A0ABD3U684_9LAMI